MSKTISTDNILILWLFTAVMAIVLLVAAHTHKVSAPTMQWQSDTSWVKGWNYIKNVAE